MNSNSSPTNKERNKKNFPSSTRTRTTRPTSPTRSISPPNPSAASASASVELLTTEALSLYENPNPRSFPYSVKQQCWDKAEKIKNRDPDRWRRDYLGNIVFRKLVGCPGCLCHDYDHIVPYSKLRLVEAEMGSLQLVEGKIGKLKAEDMIFKYVNM